jgi:hypothetical protein
MAKFEVMKFSVKRLDRTLLQFTWFLFGKKYRQLTKDLGIIQKAPVQF